MNTLVQTISLERLALMAIPVGAVLLIFLRWSLQARSIVYATFRMVGQLILVGFLLTTIFEAEHAALICAVLMIMLAFASWIALRPIPARRRQLLWFSFISLFIGCMSILFLVTCGVLEIFPWEHPRYVIPLAGMIFANAMTTISLGADRFFTEMEAHHDYLLARRKSFETSLIPIINTFFAVGIVSLPGMMTGQILAGVDPLMAIRYQILVMCMLLGGSGISCAIFLSLLKDKVISA